MLIPQKKRSPIHKNIIYFFISGFSKDQIRDFMRFIWPFIKRMFEKYVRKRVRCEPGIQQELARVAAVIEEELNAGVGVAVQSANISELDGYSDAISYVSNENNLPVNRVAPVSRVVTAQVHSNKKC